MNDEQQLTTHADSTSCWLVTRFVARDTHAAAEVRTLLDGVRSTVASEPGSRIYAVVADLDDPNSTWVLEEWATRADAQRHEAKASAGAGARHLQTLLAEPFAPSHLAVISETNTTKMGDSS